LTGGATNEKLYKKVRLFFLEWLEKYIIVNNLQNNEVPALCKTNLIQHENGVTFNFFDHPGYKYARTKGVN
jgi:hypothetical protein